MKLRRLKNAEYDTAVRLADRSGTGLDTCPTCGSTTEHVPGHPEIHGREPGTYRYGNREHPCDCDTQIALRRHYFVANIGDQYQRLDWNDYDSEEVKEVVAEYLEKWPSMKVNGMGLEFNSSSLGVGKTFAATHVGKELIKQGERVFFVPFLDVVAALSHSHPEADEIYERLRDVAVLILDEVGEPWTAPQRDLFAAKLEEIIRQRTNFNLVTIMTTNLDEKKLRQIYPRVYSLLEAKQIRVPMTGADARQGKIAEKNLRLSLDGEVAPIT